MDKVFKDIMVKALERTGNAIDKNEHGVQRIRLPEVGRQKQRSKKWGFMILAKVANM